MLRDAGYDAERSMECDGASGLMFAKFPGWLRATLQELNRWETRRPGTSHPPPVSVKS
jgi:hypothetical protein